MEGGNYSPFFYSSSSGEGRGELWHLFLIIVWGRVFIIFYLRWSVGVAFLTRISIYHQVNAKRKNIEYIKLLWHVSEYIAAIWTDNFDIVPGKFRYDGSMQRPLVFVARSYLQDTMRYIAVRNSNTGTSLVTYCIATLRLVDFNSSYQILNFVASDSVPCWFVIELAKNFGLICTFFSRQSWKTQWWTSAMSPSSVLKFVMLSALWPIYCALLRKSIF